MAKALLHAPQVMTDADVREIGKVQQKYGVKESDLAAAFPGKVKRKYRENGSYTWSLDIKTNEGGKHTKDNQKIIDMMTPFWRADQERHGKLQSRAERVALKDETGSAHHVPVAAAEQAERNNGWRAGHRIKVLREDRRHSLRCKSCGELPYWCECDS